MPQAKLVLTIPEGVWIGDLSRRFPDARFRILAAIADEGTGVGLAEIGGVDLGTLTTEMRSSDSVTDLEVLQANEGRALVQFETTVPLLLLPVQDSGIPLEMPFDIEDGEAVWEVTAPRDRLSELGDRLSAFGIPFTVEQVTHRVDRPRLLTDRQERLVRAAVDRGYYDTPRTCTLTDLADALGLAKSTVSETLHRAEERIVKQFVEDELDDAVDAIVE